MIGIASLSVGDHRLLTALLAGFAAFASVVGSSSALAAYLSVRGEEDPADTANAAAVGLARGFLLACLATTAAVLDSLGTIGS
jgi:hypothetical protein